MGGSPREVDDLTPPAYWVCEWCGTQSMPTQLIRSDGTVLRSINTTEHAVDCPYHEPMRMSGWAVSVSPRGGLAAWPPKKGGSMSRALPVTLPNRMAVAAPTMTGTPQTITALPVKVDLELYAGDDFFLDLTVSNPDGSDADLTGTGPQSMIRATPQATSVLATLAVTIDPADTGLLHLTLTSAQSTGLPPSCVYDVQLTDPYVITLIAGKITMHAEVTR